MASSSWRSCLLSRGCNERRPGAQELMKTKLRVKWVGEEGATISVVILTNCRMKCKLRRQLRHSKCCFPFKWNRILHCSSNNEVQTSLDIKVRSTSDIIFQCKRPLNGMISNINKSVRDLCFSLYFLFFLFF